MANMAWRFVHAADLHLDTSFSGLSKIDSRIAERFREASLQAFRNLLDLTIDQQAAFLLLAGDLYDGRDRDLRAQRVIRDGIRQLATHGIQVFIVHGNHDPLTPEWRQSLAAEPNLTIFGTDTPETVEVVRDGTVIATVTGLSFATSAVRDNLAQQFVAPHNMFALSIALLHANVDGNPAHDAYAPCTRRQLFDSGFDYWALGHVHTRATWQEGGRYVAYPGNLQGRSFKPSELGPKGALVVEVVEGVVAEPRFVSCDVVRLVEHDVSASSVQDALGLDDVIIPAIEDLIAVNDHKPVALRLRLLDVPQQLASTTSIETVRNQINELLSDRDPWCWIDRIRVESLAQDERDLSAFGQQTVAQLGRTISDPDVRRTAIRTVTDDIGETHRRIILDAVGALSMTQAEADAVKNWDDLCALVITDRASTAEQTIAEVLR
jgi:DNA repair exonuclease SbcCD nuclease subunit